MSPLNNLPGVLFRAGLADAGGRPRPTLSNTPGGDSGGPSRLTPAPHRPQRPRASHPGDALGRPRSSPPDEEDPPEQTATTTFTPHVFKTTPE